MKREIERRREPGGIEIIKSRIRRGGVVGKGSRNSMGMGVFLEKDVRRERERGGANGFGSTEEVAKGPVWGEGEGGRRKEREEKI